MGLFARLVDWLKPASNTSLDTLAEKPMGFIDWLKNLLQKPADTNISPENNYRGNQQPKPPTSSVSAPSQPATEQQQAAALASTPAVKKAAEVAIGDKSQPPVANTPSVPSQPQQNLAATSTSKTSSQNGLAAAPAQQAEPRVDIIDQSVYMTNNSISAPSVYFDTKVEERNRTSTEKHEHGIRPKIENIAGSQFKMNGFSSSEKTSPVSFEGATVGPSESGKPTTFKSFTITEEGDFHKINFGKDEAGREHLKYEHCDFTSLTTEQLSAAARGTTLKSPDLSNDMRKIDLQGTTFAGASLHGKDFTGADLRNTEYAGKSEFMSEISSSTKFAKADLRGAELSFGYKGEIDSAKDMFKDAKFDTKTLERTTKAAYSGTPKIMEMMLRDSKEQFLEAYKGANKETKTYIQNKVAPDIENQLKAHNEEKFKVSQQNKSEPEQPSVVEKGKVKPALSKDTDMDKALSAAGKAGVSNKTIQQPTSSIVPPPAEAKRAHAR